MEKVKIAVIGAGPAGIAVAIEAKANNIEPVVVLERSECICNTIVKFYKPGKRVDANFRKEDIKPLGICSFETETKEEFLQRIENWVKKWKLDIRLKSEVTEIKERNGEYEIFVKDKPEFLSEYVVIAIGIFGKPNRPSYPIPKELEDKVFLEPPLEIPKNKKVLVVGGGNTAAEVACALCEANQVFLSYRRPQFFRINEINLKNLEKRKKQGRLTLLMATDIEKIEPYNDRIKVFFKDGKEEIYNLIYYCLGGTTPKNFLRRIGIEFDEKGEPLMDEFFETNLPKIFLAGDIALKQGSIMKAFNSAHIIIKRIKEKYLSG
ncbi:MAG: NAD(P)-binding domain-containing protein [Thermodesulfobacterium sp.]|nr:NAD(P)-binding domain-containing protein [Thermodesulfobacterium sp.]